MAGVGSAPGERRGGRKKGTPNKVDADIKAAFREHGPKLVAALIKLTKSEDENVRLKALQICLDRGYGKATQHIEAEISVYDSLDGGYENLLHVMLEFEMQPQELWSMIMRESELPDCTMPLTIQIGFNH